MTEAPPKLRIRGLRKSFGDKRVLDGIDLDVMPRTSMVVIGGSGSGKSVLLKCVLGLLRPDDGVIEIDGRDVLRMRRGDAEDARARIGMLFQNGALFDSLPVWENVAFGLLAQRRIGRAAARERAAEILAQVGLAASVGEMSPAELSGGMQKRVALARAIAAQPDMMFFDEPTTGLDPIITHVLTGLILHLREKLNGTAVVVSHDLASIYLMADYVAMLFEGAIIAYGTVDEIKSSPNPIVQQFLQGSEVGPIPI
jgi:phospholipid/cholesterol/gamma-HCH transport system ATP-binding protein